MASAAPGETVNALACPQCGGTNQLPSGARLLACAFCGATLFVDRSGLVSHYRLPRLVDAEAARAALRRWMAGNETVKGLDREATIEEVAPVSFPMWLFRARTPRGESVAVEPAAPTPIPQLADLAVPAGALAAYTPEEGADVVAAGVPLATARGWLPTGHSEGVTETALVHVPLWRCRYTYRGKPYTAMVEGSTGAVLAAVFPEKAESPYWVVAIVGLLAFLAEGFLIPSLFWKLLAYAATAVPLTGLAYWVARKV